MARLRAATGRTDAGGDGTRKLHLEETVVKHSWRTTGVRVEVGTTIGHVRSQDGLNLPSWNPTFHLSCEMATAVATVTLMWIEWKEKKR